MNTARLNDMVPQRDIRRENQYSTGMPKTHKHHTKPGVKLLAQTHICINSHFWVSALQTLSHTTPGPILTAKFFLPFHFVVQEGGLLEEVCDLAALLVLLRGSKHTELRLLRQELADGMNRKHYLLHAAVVPHNLHVT